MKKIQAILFVVIIICVFILIIRNVFFEKSVEDVVEEIKDTEITLRISKAGELDYYKQRSIQNTFCIELMARLWNKFPEERKWLKKYIQAMVDSSGANKIDENKDIIINLE